MILKKKNILTGRELCDIEELIFPIVIELDENMVEKEQKKLFSDLIEKNGEDLVKLCYANDDSSVIIDIEGPYRLRLLEDLPEILNFIMVKDEGKSQQKPMRITKRS